MSTEVYSGDSLTVSGSLPSRSMSLGIFDPPFSTLYGYGYKSFMTDRLDAAEDKLTEHGLLASVNYRDGADIVKDHMEGKGYKHICESLIPIVDRGHKRKFPHVHLDIYSKHDLDIHFPAGDIRHKPGNGRVNEGMPTWETELLMYATGVGPGDTVLDFFGGSGAVSIAAHAYGAHAICIEKEDYRYKAINARIEQFNKLSKKRNKCSIKSCVRDQSTAGLCSCHYQLLRQYNRDNRSAFFGSNRDNDIVATFKWRQLEYLKMSKMLVKLARLSNKGKLS